MYEDSEPEEVLSVLACTQKLIDNNERVLADLDNERKNYKATIDDLRNKQEQVMIMLNDIRPQVRALNNVVAQVKSILTVKFL